MNAKTLTLALLCAFALAAPAMAAPPRSTEDNDKIVLQNDHVTIWFQGKKPMLKVIPAANASEGDNASGAYSYKFTDVVEYRDLNGDGVPAANEIVASLDLDKASAWTVNRSEEGGAVVLNLTLKGPVKMGPKADGVPLPRDVNVSLPDREAEVGLVFKLHEGAATVQAGQTNFTVPATSMKYDFVVAKWPFVDAAGARLALVMQVDGALETQAEGGLEGARVSANETEVGVLAWTPTALGLRADGSEVEVPVKTATQQAEGNATRLVHTYDAPGLASLVHDPTIGVTPTDEAMQPTGSDGATRGEGTNKVPGPAALLALTGLGLTALALRRR